MSQLRNSTQHSRANVLAAAVVARQSRADAGAHGAVGRVVAQLAITATFNLDDTILIESDSYARSETCTQLETGAAITAALDGAEPVPIPDGGASAGAQPESWCPTGTKATCRASWLDLGCGPVWAEIDGAVGLRRGIVSCESAIAASLWTMVASAMVKWLPESRILQIGIPQ